MPKEITGTVYFHSQSGLWSDIFISYRRKDSWVMANLLFEKLCNLGYDVFLDTRDEKIYETDFEPVLLENLQNAKDHIILISPASFIQKDNDHYLKEIDCTSNIGSVRKIPVIIESYNRDLQNDLSSCTMPCLSKLASKTFTSISNDSSAFPDTFGRIIKRLSSVPSFNKTELKSRALIENLQATKPLLQ